ncbi:MAG TPA: ABC transporter permease [Nitrososphaerales archaeon]|nr:ABC transporter permease [Nitrososphaerales archaeon]
MAQSSTSRNDVPNSMTQVGITMRYTFRDYLRSRRFVILLGIMLIISAILTGVVGYYRPASFVSSGVLSFYSGWWGMSVTFITVLSGIFFGGDAISGEFQNKTGYFTLPNPIRRSSVYIGKWLSAFIASSIVLLIFTAITIANESYYFGLNIPWQFAESVLFAWFYLAAVLGFTFFFSSLFKSTSYSILVTAILFLFAFTLIQTLIAALAQVEPWFILTYGSEIIGNVLLPTYPQHITKVSGAFGGGREGAPTFTSFNVTVPEGLAIIGVYFIVTAVLGLVLFERKEFN